VLVKARNLKTNIITEHVTPKAASPFPDFQKFLIGACLHCSVTSGKIGTKRFRTRRFS